MCAILVDEAMRRSWMQEHLKWNLSADPAKVATSVGDHRPPFLARPGEMTAEVSSIGAGAVSVGRKTLEFA